jgi:hypothetical protein
LGFDLSVLVDGLGAEGVPGVVDFDDGWVGEVVGDYGGDVSFVDWITFGHGQG